MADSAPPMRRGEMIIRLPKALGITLSTVFLIGTNSCQRLPNSDLQELPSWSLSEPSLVLGTREDGPTAFSPIRGIAVGPRSELHILLPQEQQIRVFSDEGELLGSIGAQGEGPGEFSRPGRIGFAADTLWVIDEPAGRISFFHEGVFLRVQPLPDVGDLHPERLSLVVGVMAGPKVLIATNAQTFRQPAVTNQPGLLLARSDGVLDTLAAINVDHVAGFLVKGSLGAIEGVSLFSQPFSPGTHWTLAPGGSDLLVVSGHLSDKENPVLSINEISASGDTVFTALHPYRPIPIPETVVDSILTRYMTRGFTRAEVREAVYLPTAYPPISDVLAATDGTAWVAREHLPGRPRRWQVVSEQGDLIAEVEAPIGYEIRWVGETTVWGLVLDELDVPFLVKRSIIRE